MSNISPVHLFFYVKQKGFRDQQMSYQLNHLGWRCNGIESSHNWWNGQLLSHPFSTKCRVDPREVVFLKIMLLNFEVFCRDLKIKNMK